MTETPSRNGDHDGLHVGIIMDGNGRWATARKRPREWGHRQGARAVRRIVEAAPDLGIHTLTLYAFSSDNWQRPEREVGLLMKLFGRYLRSETDELAENGVELKVVGRRDRLDGPLVCSIEQAEARTRGGRRMRLRLAVDYSARDVITAAVHEGVRQGGTDREGLAALLGRAMNDTGPASDVDLLIRTGGEQRLSDFLLWECAYAELLFTPRMWPDFDAEELEQAVEEYRSRDRRFGRVALAV
ncbi:MAG: polyprenyl diphosphate synthase [Gemmatimonadota bacterium]|nr:polyprenyl diphosphate synthase [Gemmatimonadota bacterium]